MALCAAHPVPVEGCYRCKLVGLSFSTGAPATHVKGGSPWKDNPVVQRIEEVSGVQVDTDAFGRKEAP